MKVDINTQSSIKINDIFFDPFRINERQEDINYIFITHSHYDHFDIDSIIKIKNSNTKIIVPNDEKILDVIYNYFDNYNVIIVDPNKEYEIDGLIFKTVPAYNLDKPYHLKEYNWVGYVINIDNNICYIMGDTDGLKENENIECDILFIPIGGTYTMNYIEASNFTNIIKPKKVIPIHYGSIVGNKDLGDKFIKLIDKNIEYELKLK